MEDSRGAEAVRNPLVQYAVASHLLTGLRAGEVLS